MRKRPRYSYRDMPYRPPRERFEREAGPYGLLLRFMRRYIYPHRWAVAMCILLASLNSSSAYLQAYYGRIVVDDILVVGRNEAPTLAAQNQNNIPGRGPVARRRTLADSAERTRLDSQVRPPWAGRKLLALFLVYIGTLVALSVANRIAQRTQFTLAQIITTRLREDIHKKVLELSASYHQAQTPGRLMARILSDVRMVQHQMMQLLITASSQVIMFLVGFIIVCRLDGRVAVVVVLAMVPYALGLGHARRQMRNVNREIRHTNSCLWSLVSQKLDAIRAILAYGRQRMEFLNLHRLSASMLRDTIRQQQLGAGVGRSAELITTLTTRGIFIYCTVMVLDGHMTLGKMMFIFGAATNLFMPVMHLTQLATQVSFLLVVLQRLTHVFETPVQVAESSSALPFPSPIEKGIRFDHVSFAYQDDSPPVLHDITMGIRAGRWVCIMGPSGSGKTTLLNLLVRLYDPTEGEITVDGTHLDAIRFKTLRRRMSMVPQEPQILGGTVRDNITYGFPDATPDQIMAAARAADCHDFIMQLPIQYETTIGEKGITLSGGQRQRISIARALLTNPEVLVLDDCTSALDANTEQRIQETLAQLMHGKTAVIVSQRVSMAMRCHRIVVLEHGRITERGTHEQLLSLGGYYTRLHAQQTE